MNTPYEEEIYYGWYGRYHSLSGNIHPLGTAFELFGHKKMNDFTFFPSHLNYLCSQLPPSLGISPNLIIEKHTYFSFFRPFLSNNSIKNLLQCMLYNKHSNAKHLLGLNSCNLLRNNVIKICSSCMNEDLENTGELYIHRSHQVPGCFFCNKHLIPLEYISLPIQNFMDEFITLDKIINYRSSFNISDKIYVELYNLSVDIFYLLNNNLNSYDISAIYQKYNDKLKLLRYSSINGVLNPIKLINEIRSYYSNDFLEFLNTSFDIDLDENWTYRLGKDKSSIIDPIKHLILIRFLFGSASNFFESSEKFQPFGSGPWPCLNVACDNYKKNTITSCKIKKSRKGNGFYGTFKCNCGYTYTARIDDVSKCDNIKYRVSIQGDIWEDKLKKIIVSGNYSIRHIADLMNCDSGVVLFHAKALNLLQYLNTKANIQKLKGRRDTALRAEYKNKILKFIKDNPTVSRSDVDRAFHSECSLLSLYERDWYDKTLPQPLPKKLNIKIKHETVNWHERDVNISKKVSKVILELKEKTDLKITKNRIAKKSGYSFLHYTKVVAKLPITSMIINKSLESKEEYCKRRINYFIKNSIESGNEITSSKVRRKLNISLKKEKEYNYKIDEIIENYRNR
jgi:hypothetical protein